MTNVHICFIISSGGFELRHRMSRLHEHMTLLRTSDQSCWLAEACKILLLL